MSSAQSRPCALICNPRKITLSLSLSLSPSLALVLSAVVVALAMVLSNCFPPPLHLPSPLLRRRSRLSGEGTLTPSVSSARRACKGRGRGRSGAESFFLSHDSSRPGARNRGSKHAGIEGHD